MNARSFSTGCNRNCNQGRSCTCNEIDFAQMPSPPAKLWTPEHSNAVVLPTKRGLWRRVCDWFTEGLL